MSDPGDVTPEAVVERQLAAYNAHDLDAFAATYAPDVEIENRHGETAVGRDRLRETYGPQFALGRCHAVITARLTHGDWVVDHETAHGLAGDPVTVLVAYRVRDGLIDRVRFMA